MIIVIIYHLYFYDGAKITQEKLKKYYEYKKNKTMKDTCIFIDCNITPTFNYKDQKKGLCCSKHKLDGMIHLIKKKKCFFPDCNTVPSFNFSGQKSLYCVKHKIDGMVYLGTIQKCFFQDCVVKPSFNYPGVKRYLYCSEHKLDGMVRVVKPNERCRGVSKKEKQPSEFIKYLFY